MTDRIHTLTVALAEPIRDDDVEPLVAAICLMRGVIGVEKNVTDHNAYWARSTALAEMQQKLREIVFPDFR